MSPERWPSPVPSPDFVRFVEVPSEHVERASGVVEEIRNGALTGVIVRGFVSRELGNASVARLTPLRDAARQAPRSSESPVFFYLGMTLIRSRAPDLADYFASGSSLASTLPRLFDDSAGFVARLRDCLGTLAGPRPLRSDYLGRTYPLFAIRCLPHDAELPAHTDLTQRLQPSLEAVCQRLDPEATVLSFLVRLSAGASNDDRLTVYSKRAQWPLERLTREEMDRQRQTIEEDYEHFQVPLGQGDLVVFDSGRHYHRVKRAPAAAGDRWTLGGFMSFSTDLSELCAWA